MLEEIKKQLINRTMKIMQSEKSMKFVNSEEFQRAIMFAFQAGYKVRDNLDKFRREVAGRFDLVTREEVDELRHRITMLERHLFETRE